MAISSKIRRAIDPHLRKEIKYRLVDRDMKQADLARLSGVTPNTVSRLLDSSRHYEDPKWSTLVALAEALNCRIKVSLEDKEHHVTVAHHKTPTPRRKAKTKAKS